MNTCSRSSRTFTIAASGEELPSQLAAHAASCASCQAAVERARRFGSGLTSAATSLTTPAMPDLRVTLEYERPLAGGPSLVAVMATVAGAVVVVALLLSALGVTSPPIGTPSTPSPSGLPSASPTVEPSSGSTVSASPRPSPAPTTSATPGATPMHIEGPSQVRDRSALPWCGHEVVERTENVTDLYDAEVRACFLEAYEADQPAEFVTDGPTVETGRTRSIYRHLASGEIEIFIDSTEDPLATPGWTRVVCRSIRIDHEDPRGIPVFVGDDCDEPVLVSE